MGQQLGWDQSVYARLIHRSRFKLTPAQAPNSEHQKICALVQTLADPGLTQFSRLWVAPFFNALKLQIRKL